MVKSSPGVTPKPRFGPNLDSTAPSLPPCSGCGAQGVWRDSGPALCKHPRSPIAQGVGLGLVLGLTLILLYANTLAPPLQSFEIHPLLYANTPARPLLRTQSFGNHPLLYANTGLDEVGAGVV